MPAGKLPSLKPEKEFNAHFNSLIFCFFFFWYWEQQIWSDIGESEAEKDRMLMELERECLEVYRRKVDEAANAKARLYHSVAAKEAEVATLMAALGELNIQSPVKRVLLHSFIVNATCSFMHFPWWYHLLILFLFYYSQIQTEKKVASLKEKLASVTPLLEDLRVKREERLKQFADIKTQIEKISGEISGYNYPNDTMISCLSLEDHDLTLRKLTEVKTHLQALQKEKVWIFNVWNVM